MPPRLKRRADIGDLAMFVGMGGDFQIWNPHVALKSEARQLRELAADLLDERGAA
jgi:MraZ protein